MSPGALLDALRAVPLLADAGEDVLRRLALGAVLDLAPGARLRAEGEPAGPVYLLLEGELQTTRRVGAQEVYVLTLRPPTLLGHELLLLDAPYLASVWATAPSRVLHVEEAAFWPLLGASPELARALLRTTAQRARELEIAAQQQARLAAVSTLAAGLSHELNNPAAAVVRGAGEARRIAARLPALAAAVGALDAGAREAAARALSAGLDGGAPVPADPLALAAREDALADWLDAAGVPDAWQLAATLAGCGVEPASLAALAADAGGAAMPALVPWLEALLCVDRTLRTVEESAARISDVVRRTQAYAWMDRAPLQEVDVAASVEAAVALLAARLPAGVMVDRSYDGGVAPVQAFAGELSLVWTQLLENARQAVGEAGRIAVRVLGMGERVRVEIEDDGPGIPPEVAPRVFEPFFTTRDLGEGTGLGLYVARRIVEERHGGSLRIESRPGRTCVIVTLPPHPRPQPGETSAG